MQQTHQELPEQNECRWRYTFSCMRWHVQGHAQLVHCHSRQHHPIADVARTPLAGLHAAAALCGQFLMLLLLPSAATACSMQLLSLCQI
jgi:hypothetical protein